MILPAKPSVSPDPAMSPFMQLRRQQQMGAKVVTVSDSTGWVYDPDGIDVELLKEVKEVKRARLTEYCARGPMPSITKAVVSGRFHVMWRCRVQPKMNCSWMMPNSW